MRIQKTGVMLLLLLLLSGCANLDTAPSAQEDEISIEALFQTEGGDALQGSAACFSTETNRSYCQVGNDGRVSVAGLPRNGELLLTLFDQRQEVQGIITLSFGQGAVIDATTSEDGVGYITVRDDTSEVALIFVLTEDGALQCTLWLAGTIPSNADLSYSSFQNSHQHPVGAGITRPLCQPAPRDPRADDIRPYIWQEF